MAGGASAASHGKSSVSQRLALGHPLHVMFAIKADDIEIASYKIQHGCHRFFDGNVFIAGIFDKDCSGNDICFFQNAIQKLHFHHAGFVPEGNFQRVCIFL